MVESLVPYEIFPDEETELVSRILEQHPNATYIQLTEYISKSPDVVTLIAKRFLQKVDWKWLEHKHSNFKVL